MPLQAPLWIPAAIFLYFYYRKNNKLPFPVGLWVSPLFGIAGMPDPVAPPAPPAPPTPDPPCPVCPTGEKIMNTPVNVAGTVQITQPGGSTTDQPFEFPTYTVSQLPKVYNDFKQFQKAKEGDGTDIKLSGVTIRRVGSPLLGDDDSSHTSY